MGMTELRTTLEAHVSPDGEQDLLQFANRSPLPTWAASKPVRLRATDPAPRATFDEHAHDVVERYRLEGHRIAGWVTDVQPVERGGFLVEVAAFPQHERILATRIVVAVGLGQPCLPGYGPATWRMMHSSGIDVNDNWARLRVCIVGGGLTGGTLAVNLVARGASVVLCTRSRLSVSQLEADPEWLPGGRLNEVFQKTPDPNERERQIRGARVGRGLTPSIRDALERLAQSGEVRIREETPLGSWRLDMQGRPVLSWTDEPFDRVVCATGFEQDVSRVPFLRSVQSSIRKSGGVPWVSSQFESQDVPGLFFMGRLGELAGGALARNIPGARDAAKTIAGAFGAA
jgi:cation diffusion facilitator CzcD-associated flavoprotein CzcO